MVVLQLELVPRFPTCLVAFFTQDSVSAELFLKS